MLSVEEELKTPCVKGGPEEGPAIPLGTKVGLCERNCVSVIGNYNSDLTLMAIISEILEGPLQESSIICSSQSSAFSPFPSTLKLSRSSKSGSRLGTNWSSW